MAQQVVVIEPDYFSVEVTAPQTVTISNTGPQGATGPTGATGATGPQGPSGVVSVSSPITNTGTSTAANIGIDQTLLSITQSQVTNLTTDLAAKAPLASPALSGTPTAPTAAVDTNTTQIATTGYVVGQGYLKSATASSTYAPLASPTFTGDPKAPTPTSTDNDTSIATTAFVQAQKTSPALAGTPTAPTAAVNTSTTQLATTEFVDEGTNDIRQYASDKSVLENIPARVHPAENLLKQAVFWIDSNHSSASGQTISNLGWGGSVLNATAGSSGSADSNDPKFLSWDGTNYVYTPGSGINYLGVPNAGTTWPTGDIDLRFYATADAWIPTAPTRTMICKDNGSTQRSFSFDLNPTTGYLGFWWTTDGTTSTRVVKASTVATGVADGAAKWVRVTRSSSTGDIIFYTSDNGVTWTQLGATVTSTPSSIFNSTSQVEIGVNTAFTQPWSGKIFRAQVLNGIAGTPVLDVDTSLINSGSATSFTARTGQTVTINRATSGRKTVAVVHPVWLFGTDDYIEVADNDLIDFGATDSFSIALVVRQWNTPASSQPYLQKGSDSGARIRIATNGTNLTTRAIISDGTNSIDRVSGAVTVGGTSVLAMVVDRSAQTWTYTINAGQTDTVSTSSVGSLASNVSLRIGRREAATYQDFEFIAVAVFRKALTTGEVQTLSNYFQGRAV